MECIESAGLATAVTCVKSAAHYIAVVEVLSTEEANMKSLFAGVGGAGLKHGLIFPVILVVHFETRNTFEI
jgi:hypothetical protein